MPRTILDGGFWQGTRVLLTGNTGFKGAWLSLWLQELGADVHGFALPPEQALCVFNLARCANGNDNLGDLRDAEAVRRVVSNVAPEVVIHLAAQALVRRSYREPVRTFATNIIGTANLLDALHTVHRPRGILVVTSDKVYANDDAGAAFRETDPLGGHDPYAASKACQEILTRSFATCFFAPLGIPLVTARAGNVIGGGDWSEDRLVSDMVRAAQEQSTVRLRNPLATRPWQHVLEPLHGYLLYCQRILTDASAPPQSLNFGPLQSHTVEACARELAEHLGATIELADRTDEPYESNALVLDSAKARRELGWQPLLDLPTTLRWIAEWHQQHRRGADMRQVSLAQIARYEERLPT